MVVANLGLMMRQIIGWDLCNKRLLPKYRVEIVLKSSFTRRKLLFCARFRLVFAQSKVIAKVPDWHFYEIFE